MKNINLDFSVPIVINTYDQNWLPSPMEGVSRMPLAREGSEDGHATSIVKYEPGSRFKTHSHPLGEEIFVLEGVFSDQHGDYPAGTYLRNPSNSSHTPFSEQGCVIFVKLQQFKPLDKTEVRINTQTTSWLQGQGGLQVMPLHEFEEQSTALVKWPAGEHFLPHRHYGGEEILVLSGEFIDEHGHYPEGTWMRSPHMSQHCPYVDVETVIMVKIGHLPA